MAFALLDVTQTLSGGMCLCRQARSRRTASGEAESGCNDILFHTRNATRLRRVKQNWATPSVSPTAPGQGTARRRPGVLELGAAMWFDVQAALAEIKGAPKPAPDARPPATSATSATKPARVADVASVAAPPARQTAASETSPHGLSVAKSPLTWTGRVVSLDHWRKLSEWERHGPNGQHWCGIARDWVDPKGE